MVTAEFAVAMPAVVLVLALACAVLGFVVDEIRCTDAARAGARAASRGDATAAVRRIAEPLAPPGATVSVSGGAVVRVVVHAPARRLGGWLPAGWDARATAELPREAPGASGGAIAPDQRTRGTSNRAAPAAPPATGARR